MSNFEQTQTEIKLESVAEIAKQRKDEGWHFIQMLALKTQKANDLVYSYRKDNKMEDLIVRDVTEADKIPSITGSYIAAFVFENEAHDLFGLNIEGIAIDFKGKFYKVAVDKPMSIISPEVAERVEKQAKIDAAMAAKKAKDATKSTVKADKPAAKSADKKEAKPASKTVAKPASKAQTTPKDNKSEGKGE